MQEKRQASGEAITQAMDVGKQSIEAATHFSEQVASHPTLGKNPELEKISKNYLESVEFMHKCAVPVWKGFFRELDPVKNMLVNQGSALASSITKALAPGEDIRMGIAINDSGQITRAFGKLEGNDAANMDVLMQSWFAKNGYAFREGVVVMLDGLKKNPVQVIKADIATLRDQLKDPEKGIAKFCENAGVPVHFRLYDQPGGTLLGEHKTAPNAMKATLEAGRAAEKKAPAQRDVTPESSVSATRSN